MERPSTCLGTGRPSRVRIVGVASISRALRQRPEASPAPASATIPSGRWVPGRFGSVVDPRGIGGELGADPVRIVRQRDQVGVAFAGRIELVGRGGGDDLREERPPGFGMAGFAKCLAAAARASSIWRGVNRGAVRLVSRPDGRPSSRKPSRPCPGAGQKPVSASSRKGTATKPTGRTKPSAPSGHLVSLPRAANGRAPVASAGRVAGPARQPGDPGLDQNAVDVDPSQARAEAMVADDHDGRARGGRPARRAADGVVQAADHLGRRRVPGRVVDPGLIHVQVAPDAVLERVEVLELDHEHRPVGDNRSASRPPSARPRKLSAVSRAFVASSSSDCGAPLPEVAQASSRAPRP